jgi:hypothetical protein
MPERFFQFAHLSADGLNRHIEPLRRARKPAFLHDDPEVMQMSIVEHASRVLAVSVDIRHFEKAEVSIRLSLIFSIVR